MVRMLRQQGPALQQTVFGEFVEAGARAGAAGQRQQFVDHLEGPLGVGGGVRARRPGRMRLVGHDLLQCGVHEPEQGAELPGLAAGQCGAAQVVAFDPGVQGLSLIHMGGAVAVEVVFEEVAAARGGEEVAVVEQALGDGFAGQRRAGAGVVAEQGSESVSVGRRRRPDYR